MISVFFDVDITLVCAPSQYHHLSDFQKSNLTSLSDCSFARFPRDYDAIHLDFHREIFNKMRISGLFFPRVLTAGLYSFPALSELTDALYSTSEEIEFSDHYMQVQRNWFEFAPYYNQRDWMERFLTKGQFIKHLKDEEELQQKKYWEKSGKDIFDFPGIADSNVWLIDDDRKQRASAEQFGFRTFDPKSKAYPILLKQAVDYVISRQTFSGFVRANLPCLFKQ